MASIFLSYAREDQPRAERIAGALEDAGHAVWWDRNVGAGSRFAAEIERALQASDLVVVLWSRASIDSAWVHDEAAAGRDSGRLVPVLIDRVDPPLGFRQYQGVDLGGRLSPAVTRRLIDAIAKRTADAGSQPSAQPAAPPRVRLDWGVLAVAGLVALLLLAGWMFLLRGTTEQQNTVAITAGRGDAQHSEELARSVALDLGRYRAGTLASLRVLSGSNRESSAAKYFVEVGVSRTGSDLRADISMSSRKRAQLLWADGVEGSADHFADLRQQVAAKVGSVLLCAIESEQSSRKLSLDALALYLKGCSQLTDATLDAPGEDTLSLFRQLTAKAPDFARGWAMLSFIELKSWPGKREAEMRAITRSAREHLRKAKQLDPATPMVFAAEASLPENYMAPGGSIAVLDRGIALNPDDAPLHSVRSEALMRIGRVTDSLNEARKAAELEPLSPVFRANYIYALATGGRTEAAYDELKRTEATWPGSTTLHDARYMLDLRYGDARNALRTLQRRGSPDARPTPGDRAWEAFLEARIDPSPAKVEEALDSFRERQRRSPGQPSYIQALGTFGRVDEAYTALESREALENFSGGPEALFRPFMRSIRADPRFMNLAYRLGLLTYWRTSGVWPDLCREPGLPYDCEKEAAKYPLRPPEN